jgi:hypothetical protein
VPDQLSEFYTVEGRVYRLFGVRSFPRGTGSVASGVQLSPSVGNARRGDFDGWIVLLGYLKVKRADGFC